MGMLRAMSGRGDDRLLWDAQDAQAGDVQAMAAVREAERIIALARARGAIAFRVEAGRSSSFYGSPGDKGGNPPGHCAGDVPG